jgi:hypothetical protein
MRNKAWVRKQFELFKSPKRRPQYRDVLLITSFIETVIKDIASSSKCTKPNNKCPKANFKRSLEVLGLRIDSNNEKKSTYEPGCQHRKDCLKRINVVRVQRNELLHDIIKRRLPPKYIDGTIKKMTKNIQQICTKSSAVRSYFVTNYRFDPALLV